MSPSSPPGPRPRLHPRTIARRHHQIHPPPLNRPPSRSTRRDQPVESGPANGRLPLSPLADQLRLDLHACTPGQRPCRTILCWSFSVIRALTVTLLDRSSRSHPRCLAGTWSSPSMRTVPHAGGSSPRSGGWGRSVPVGRCPDVWGNLTRSHPMSARGQLRRPAPRHRARLPTRRSCEGFTTRRRLRRCARPFTRAGSAKQDRPATIPKPLPNQGLRAKPRRRPR